MLPCAHCEDAPRQQDGLCRQCLKYKRCSGCEVIFGLGASEPFFGDRCESCFNFESNIKPNCITCGRPKPTTIPYFRRNGNFCLSCSASALKNAAHPTVFTDAEYGSIIRRINPQEEGSEPPEGRYSGEDVSFVSGGGKQPKHTKVARFHEKRTRGRSGVHAGQSGQGEHSPQASDDRDDTEVFA